MAKVVIQGDPEVAFTLTVREAQELHNLLNKTCPRNEGEYDPFHGLYHELLAALDDLGAL